MKNPMDIILEPVAPEKREVLFRLLQYSLFEESATDGNRMNEDGLFDYEYFDLYFCEPDREACFIKDSCSGTLLGFVMINTVTQYADGHSIAEFLVLPGYRKHGIGKRAAELCFEKHPGHWEVSPSLGSEDALRFWKSVIRSCAAENYRFENGVFLFSI